MNIQRNDENGTIRYNVTVGEADYSEAVDKVLRNYRKKANIPGFRVGMVPMGIINKMYRKGAVAEEAYRAASKAAVDDLNAAKTATLGEMIPAESQPELDFETQSEFEFVFEIGRAPQVNIALDKKDKVTKYSIKVSDEMVKSYQENVLRRSAKSEEEAAKPEINEGTIQAAFPNGEVKTVEEFGQWTTERIETELARECEFKYIADFREFLIKKAGLELPDNFLKHWLFRVNEGKFDKEQIEKDYASFAEMMRWDLIERHFAEASKLEVTPEEALQEAKAVAAMQFAYYGMGNPGDEMLENYARQMLGNQEEARRIYGKLLERKIIALAEEQVAVTTKKVSVEEFNKLFEPKQA